MRHILQLICVFLLTVGSLTSYGQDKRLSIHGVVIAAEEGTGLPLANVQLYRLPDTVLVTGTLADTAGKFEMQATAASWVLRVQYIGFVEQWVLVPNTLEDMDLGIISMEKDGDVSLDAVQIEAQGTQMELKLDKRVYNVGQDLSLAGSGADEILQNLPSVEIDAEGIISLRGSQSVRVLINGKPSGLLGNGGEIDGLRNLQASMIDRIEVITNPSARYEAEGEVGIINIILKKEKRKGVNGAFNVGTGLPHNHTLGANLNYRSGKVNFFANLNGQYRNAPGVSSYYQEEYINGELALITEQVNNRQRSELGGTLQLGADLLFNARNTLTMSGLVSYGDQLNRSAIVYEDFSAKLDPIATIERSQDENEVDQNVEFSATYEKTYAQKERKWTSTLQFQLNDDLELADITQQTIGNGALLLQQSSNRENEANWLVQTDYVQPFGAKNEFTVETGARGTFRTIENDFLVEEQDEQGAFVSLPGFDNFFVYQENIYAGYGMFSHELDKFSYQLGMRAEYTDINIDLIRTDVVIPKNYLNWFPSASMSYKLTDTRTLQLSYSRRLTRPSFRSLIPFSGFNDARNLWGGNPDLDPEYTHSIEAGHLLYWKKGSLLTSLYYRNRTGVIQRITILLEDGVTQRFPINLASQNGFGVELSASQDLTDWWSISGNANLYASITEGSYDTLDFYAEALSFDTRINSRMTFSPGWRIQATGSYRAPFNSAQGRTLALYSIDLAVAKTLLKGKGTLTFNVRDVLNSRRWRGIVDDPLFYRESSFQWRVRQFTLNFTYRLNQVDRRGRGGRSQGGRPSGGGGEGY